jgi:hypothetical protein
MEVDMRTHLGLRSLLMAAALLLAGGAGAADRNVYSAGGEVRTTAPVLGDYTAAGGHVLVDHAVSGDATLMGGSVEVRAPVGDDLRVAGGDVRIDSAVGGELLVMGGKVDLGTGLAVGRNAQVLGSKITVAGRIEGDFDAKADRVVINGEVRGDAKIHASHVELGPEAKIGGELHYVSDHELVRAEGASVAGPIAREERPVTKPRERVVDRSWRGGRWIGGVATYLGVLAVAALFLLAVPAFGAAAAQRVRSTPWTVLGLGLATLLALPMLAVLLFVTLLGIPVAFALLALYPVALLLGFVVSVLFVAGVLPPAFRLPGPQTFGASMGWFAAALLLVMVIARIPFLGALVMLFVALAGLGAGVLELHARRKRPPAPGGGARAVGPAAPAGPPADEVAGAQA